MDASTLLCQRVRSCLGVCAGLLFACTAAPRAASAVESDSARELTASSVTRTNIAFGTPLGGYASIVPVAPLGSGAGPYPPGTVIDGNWGNVNDLACFSRALRVLTAHWGDIVSPFYPEDPIHQPDIRDVASIVRRFVGEPVPSKLTCDLDGNVLLLDGSIDFRDVFTGVSAIIFAPYPFEGPVSCP